MTRKSSGVELTVFVWRSIDLVSSLRKAQVGMVVNIHYLNAEGNRKMQTRYACSDVIDLLSCAARHDVLETNRCSDIQPLCLHVA